MKDNCCEVKFYCRELKPKSCRFFEVTKEHTDCKHMDGVSCTSFKASCDELGLIHNKRKTCVDCVSSRIDFDNREKLICTCRENGFFGEDVKQRLVCKYYKSI